jgi:hypothetical protein
MTGRGDYAVHRLSPPAIRILDDRDLAEVPLTIIFHVRVDDVEAHLASRAQSQYRTQRSEGVWRIVRITSVYEGDSLVPSMPGTELRIDPQEFLGYRPSYRCLAWYMSRHGYQIGADLLGDDRPDDAARQYEAEGAWLAGSG